MTPIRSSNDENNCLSFGVWSTHTRTKKKIHIICSWEMPYMLSVVHMDSISTQLTNRKLQNAIATSSWGCFFHSGDKHSNRFEAIWLQHVKCAWLGAGDRGYESLREPSVQTKQLTFQPYSNISSSCDERCCQPTKHPIHTSHHFTSLRCRCRC